MIRKYWIHGVVIATVMVALVSWSVAKADNAAESAPIAGIVNVGQAFRDHPDFEETQRKFTKAQEQFTAELQTKIQGASEEEAAALNQAYQRKLQKLNDELTDSLIEDIYLASEIVSNDQGLGLVVANADSVLYSGGNGRVDVTETVVEAMKNLPKQPVEGATVQRGTAGTIKLGEAFQHHPGFEQAQSKFTDDQKKYMAELEAKKDEVSEEEFATLKEAYQQKLRELETNLTQSLLEDIHAAIREIAQSRQYAFVVVNDGLVCSNTEGTEAITNTVITSIQDQ